MRKLLQKDLNLRRLKSHQRSAKPSNKRVATKDKRNYTTLMDIVVKVVLNLMLQIKARSKTQEIDAADML